jgi:hypothetical protein
LKKTKGEGTAETPKAKSKKQNAKRKQRASFLLIRKGKKIID